MPGRVVFSVNQSQTSDKMAEARQNDWCSQAAMGRDSFVNFLLAFSRPTSA